MNHAQRPTVGEAIRIGYKSLEYVPSYGFLRETMKAFQCNPIDSKNNDNLVFMLFCIYNAGRMYGIRQERARRKGRQTAPAGQERS